MVPIWFGNNHKQSITPLESDEIYEGRKKGAQWKVYGMEGGVDKDIMGPGRDQEHIFTPQNQLRDP